MIVSRRVYVEMPGVSGSNDHPQDEASLYFIPL